MKKIYPFLTVLIIVLVVLWQIFFSNTNYYLVSVLIIIVSMLPFFSSFEKSEHTSKDITLIASLTALAVVSRAVFYLVPQVKPIAAVVGVSGAVLGAKRGYLIGALSMFVSNFIFGQGAWTPFQMVAMASVGLCFGLVFDHIKPTKISLSVVGFLSVLILYGLIVDLSSVLYFNSNMTFKGIVAIYASGVPFNLVFAGVTALFLYFFGETFIKKIERINNKDVIKNNDDKNPDVIDRLCRFAFIMATLGVLTVGVCPAFGVMGIVVGTIFKSKKFPLSNLNKDRIKKANFLGIVSLFLFVIDIILLVVFKSKFKA